MVNQSCYKGLIGKVSQKAGNSTPTGGGGGGGGGGGDGGGGGGYSLNWNIRLEAYCLEQPDKVQTIGTQLRMNEF